MRAGAHNSKFRPIRIDRKGSNSLGGRPAASFAKRLMMPVSNDTLLCVDQNARVENQGPLPETDIAVISGS